MAHSFGEDAGMDTSPSPSLPFTDDDLYVWLQTKLWSGPGHAMGLRPMLVLAPTAAMYTLFIVGTVFIVFVVFMATYAISTLAT